MKTKKFIGVYDFVCDDEDMDYLIYTLSRTHSIDWNDGCNSLLMVNDDITDYNFGNVETFEYYKDRWYHHNQYLEQRGTTTYKPNDHYARISRVDLSDTGQIREMSIHMMMEFSFNHDDYAYLEEIYGNQGKAWLDYRQGKQCDHRDNNRTNNHYMNLEMIPTEANRRKGLLEHLSPEEIQANEANWLDCDESKYMESIIWESKIRRRAQLLWRNEDEY